MNPPPLDMKQAQERLRVAQQQLQACIELRRAASIRIQELEAENAALREDKARLDWLGKTGGIKETGLLKTQWIIYRYPLNEQQRYDDIRDAIDAARKEPPDASV